MGAGPGAVGGLHHARLTGLIRTAAGVPDLRVRVVAKGAFSFAAQVADRYRSGRAFLVGDAAQRMTPRGGMGMNTAIAEGHDLAWKLAWVLRGWATPALLDTYEAEWRPIGSRRTARSADAGPARPAMSPSPRTSTPASPTPGSPPPTATPAPPSTSSARATPSSPARSPSPGPPPPPPWVPPYPLDVHAVDSSTATTLSIAPDGAILARPDAQVLAHWPTAPTDPAAELADWTGPRWFERQPISS